MLTVLTQTPVYLAGGYDQESAFIGPAREQMLTERLATVPSQNEFPRVHFTINGVVRTCESTEAHIQLKPARDTNGRRKCRRLK
jgi:hypothetical protein